MIQVDMQDLVSWVDRELKLRIMQLNLLLIPVFLVVFSALYIFLLISMRNIASVTLSINELTLILKIISQCDKHIN
jgi:hypothetical protein